MSDMLTEAKVLYVGLANAASTPDSETRDLIAEAQVAATLAVAAEVRSLREVVHEVLGDDSHLDGLKRRVADVAEEISHVGGTR